MTVDQAAKILREMRRRAAPEREVAIQAILFGIRYHDELTGMSLSDLSQRIGVGPDTCAVEIRHGMNLAKYVGLRCEGSRQISDAVDAVS